MSIKPRPAFARLPQQAPFQANLNRSIHLIRAFRTEQNDSASYYALLADDTVRQLGQYIDLRGRLALDVGGGPGYFVRALRDAGASAFAWMLTQANWPAPAVRCPEAYSAAHSACL